MRTQNISPKVISQLAVAVLGWVLSHYAISLDPETSGAIAAVLGALAGYFAPPGDVVVQGTPQDSQAVLDSVPPAA